MLKKIMLAIVLTGAVVATAKADFLETYVVTNSGATAYRVNGGTTNNPTLTVYRGHTYKFDWNATAPAHPFFLDTTALNNAAAVHLGAADGVTESSGAAPLNFLTWVVPATGPSIVFYQCGVHNAMSGTINVLDGQNVPATGKFGILALAALILAGGYVARRRFRTN
jgi:hypothetical protein